MNRVERIVAAFEAEKATALADMTKVRGTALLNEYKTKLVTIDLAIKLVRTTF